MHHQPLSQWERVTAQAGSFQLVHSDVCGPMDESIRGKQYFVSFIDDYSRCCAVYFMSSKAEVFEKLKEFKPHH